MDVDRFFAEVVSLGSLRKLRQSGLPCANPCLQFTPRYMRIDGGGVRVRRPLLIASARWKAGGFLPSTSINLAVSWHLFLMDRSASSKEMHEGSMKFPPGLSNNWTVDVSL